MTDSALAELGHEIWVWRERTTFRTSDDIPRIDHEPGWLPEITRASIDARRTRAAELNAQWAALDTAGLEIADQVDYRLLGSALARVTWELDVVRAWERDAVFAVGQALGPYYDLLLPVPPLDSGRQAGLITALQAVPAQLEVARGHLTRAGWAPLARAAVELLGGIGDTLDTSVAAAAALVDADRRDALHGAGREAAQALEGFAEWLDRTASQLEDAVSVGREAFVWFLRHVALLPGDPEALVAGARHEYHRAVTGEALARNRYRDHPLPDLPPSVEDQVRLHLQGEDQVRAFYETHDLLSQPDGLQRYLTAPLPDYLDRLEWLGVSDDLTAPARLDQDGVSYTPRPAADLPYFYKANARDPRLGIIHEGAHYKQLALSWAHERPIRRHYYDSVANEGIAFYNEELMLQAGLFADAPRSVEVVYNFMRLRALRVITDVSLATGAFTLEDAVAMFTERVPMDRQTAFTESAFYLATPGQAMTYLVGKLELQRLAADTITAQGTAFSWRAFHDYVWRNGNMPFSLQRWELLGDRSDVEVLDAADATTPPA